MLAVGLAVAAGYLGWVFLARHWREKKHAEAVTEKTRESYRPYANQDLEELRILHFYASPSRLTAGQDALLCYGAQGAASVRISNVEDTLKPTRNRCLTVKPSTSTTYTLSVEGHAKKGMVTATLLLKVDPPE